jgi:hypothetical protein
LGHAGLNVNSLILSAVIGIPALAEGRSFHISGIEILNIPSGLPINPVGAESLEGQEGSGMELSEVERLTDLIENVIRKRDPKEAEYWRGYCLGLEYYTYGNTNGTNQDHFILVNLAVHGCGDPYVAAYACGYHDGFTGKGSDFMV